MSLKTDIRISIKNNIIGKSHKIGLIKFLTKLRRFWLSLDGVHSKKMPEATLTQFWDSLRKFSKMIVREL